MTYEERTYNTIIVILLLLLFAVTITASLAYIFVNKNYEGIYTFNDIYYYEGKHLTSETGIDTTFNSHKELLKYLSELTALDVLPQDKVLFNIVEDYTSVRVFKEDENVILNITNPYTDNETSILTNSIDDLGFGVYEHYITN